VRVADFDAPGSISRSDSSDALHIVEPEIIKSKSKKKSRSREVEGSSEFRTKSKKHHKHHRHRHHKSKCRKKHKEKESKEKDKETKSDKKAQILELHEALAGTLDEFNELIESSNYTERIANCK